MLQLIYTYQYVCIREYLIVVIMSHCPGVQVSLTVEEKDDYGSTEREEVPQCYHKEYHFLKMNPISQYIKPLCTPCAASGPMPTAR